MINLNRLYELVALGDTSVACDYVWLEITSMCSANFYHHVGNALRNLDYDRVTRPVVLAMLSSCWVCRKRVDDWDYALAKLTRSYSMNTAALP